MKVISTLQGVPIYRDTKHGEAVTFIADADIDADGAGGNPYGDKYFQPRTTLRYKGKYLDAKKVPYVVVPPTVILHTFGVVLGCQALIVDVRSGMKVKCVVGDVGPTFKIGEISIEAARLLQVPWHPVRGGVSEKVIRYTILPGVAGYAAGVTYDLQPWRFPNAA